MPTLTAIVPATNRPATLERCRTAIEAAEQRPDEVLVVEEPARAGPAVARNLGAQRAAGDVLVFVDADVEVHPDAFARIRSAFDGDPGLTAVFGSYDDAPAAPGVVSVFRNLLHHDVHHSSPGPAQTFWAGLGAMRRDAFLDAGGFDADRYARPSIEDIELGMRLAQDGARIELRPEIQGTHLKCWSLGQMIATDFSARGVPWVGLLLDQGGSSALNLGWRHRLSAVASLSLAGGAVLRRPRIVAAAGLALVALNHRFYAMLARRQGPAEATAGVALHALHHIVSVAAVPVGVGRWLCERDARSSAPADAAR
ncbi:MAG: glycosyltransferase [Solirubrobacteraceae bacterium]